MLSFNISYPDLINFLYFADASDLKLKEGFGGGRWKEAQRQGDFMDHSIIIIVHEKSAMVEYKHYSLIFVDKNLKEEFMMMPYHLSIFGNSSVEKLMWFIGLQSTLQLQSLS